MAVEQNMSIPIDELKKLVVKLLGFSRRSSKTDMAVDKAIEFLEVMDKVTVSNGVISVK